VLEVIDPGLHTRVVDFGRPTTRGLGVAVGGAADRFCLAVGNGLVGNPPDAAALEISLSGPTLRAAVPLAGVVFGAPFEVRTDRRALTAGTTFTLWPGETLRVGGTPRGTRAYLCVRGGIRTPRVLDSRSSLGPLRAGAELPCAPGTIHGRSVRIPPDGDPHREYLAGLAQPPVVLRALAGPQIDWFAPEQFFGGPRFTVAPASDRMGLRLLGEPLRLPARELASEPVCPGSVQVTRDGQCIVLGVDGQTIGGYPKVAQVAAADRDLLGQLRPGDRVWFERVEVGEAERLYRRRRAVLREWLTRLRVGELFAVPGLLDRDGGGNIMRESPRTPRSRKRPPP
jgi:antagonist of KipI